MALVVLLLFVADEVQEVEDVLLDKVEADDVDVDVGLKEVGVKLVLLVELKDVNVRDMLVGG